MYAYEVSQLNLCLSTFEQYSEELVRDRDCRLTEESDELVQAHREVEEVREDPKKEVCRSQRQESELSTAGECWELSSGGIKV